MIGAFQKRIDGWHQSADNVIEQVRETNRKQNPKYRSCGEILTVRLISAQVGFNRHYKDVPFKQTTGFSMGAFAALSMMKAILRQHPRA
jgi:hypothetical protein